MRPSALPFSPRSRRSHRDIRDLQDVDPSRWRLRVGRYRAIFALGRGTVVVHRVLDRRDAY